MGDSSAVPVLSLTPSPLDPLNAESPPVGGLSAIRRSGGLRWQGDVHEKVSPSGCLRCLTQTSVARAPAFVGCIAVGDHLIVLHSAARACPGYDRHEAPSMLMGGASVARDTEHGRAGSAQLTRRHGTLEEAIDAGIFGLSAAHVARGVRRNARAACEDYFYTRLGLAPGYELQRAAAPDGGLELLDDPMYRVLENIVELVVDGDY